MNLLERFVAFGLPLGIGLYVLIGTFFGGDLSLLPGDLGDTRFNITILEHCYQYFTGQVDSFWNAGFMYPEAEVISISDNLLGSAPIYALFRSLGFDIFSSFQFWAIVLAVLNYTAAFLLFTYVSKNSWLSGIAAFAFAFSIGLAAQMSHAQTFPRFAIPLALLFLLLWKDKKQWKWFLLATLSLTYTFYCGIYLGFLMFLPFALIFGYTVFHNWGAIKTDLSNIRYLLYYGLTIVLNLALIYLLFAPYLRRSASNPLHSYGEIKESISTLESYVSAHPGTLMHGSLENFIGGEQIAYWDHWLFPGWMIFLGMITMIILAFRKSWIPNSFHVNNTWLLLAAGVITFLFFLRINGVSLYYLLYQLPGFGAMRALQRIINVELLFFGLGLTVLLSYLSTFVKNYRVFIFLIALCMLTFDNLMDPDQANTTAKSTMQERHRILVDKMKDIPKGSVVSYEPDLDHLNTHIIHYQIDAILAAQSLGLKSVNGYSAQAAFMFDQYWISPNEETRKYWFSRFKSISDDHVYIIH